MKYVDCWNWAGYIAPNGYGYVKINGENPRGAHRVVYKNLVGDIPDGLELDHLCLNKSCVNPKHLEIVTRQENQQRAKQWKTACPKGHPYKIYMRVSHKNQHYCHGCRMDYQRHYRLGVA